MGTNKDGKQANGKQAVKTIEPAKTNKPKQKRVKYESLDTLKPEDRIRRWFFVRGPKGDQLWREQELRWLNAKHTKAVADVESKFVEMGKRVVKIAKDPAKVREQLNKLKVRQAELEAALAASEGK